jgi:hypothetical protein
LGSKCNPKQWYHSLTEQPGRISRRVKISLIKGDQSWLGPVRYSKK